MRSVQDVDSGAADLSAHCLRRSGRKFKIASPPSSPAPRVPQPGHSLREALAQFLLNLESMKTQSLPGRLNQLLNAGLPIEIQQCVFQFLPGTQRDLGIPYEEIDIAKAMLESLGILVQERAIDVRLSRQFLRTLRNLFSSPDESRELRDQVQSAVRTVLESK